MASCQVWSLQQQWLVVLLLFVAVSLAVPSAITGCYTSIFSFGDSLTDTGNLYFVSQPQRPDCLLPPYGETHFQHPNGRCSDGRLILDFIAESVGLPYVKPYLGFKNGAVKRGDVGQGVNFAVAGATALKRSFFEEKGFTVEVTTNYSLRVQLDWFKELLPSLCNSSSSCKKVLHSSLFIVGEIGGNDYGYPLSETKALEELRTYIPQVISVITSVVRELIDLEAVTLIVPGILPLGCNPSYLTRFATIDEEEYDQAGCLKWLNKFFEYHNELLQIELNRLRVLYPHTSIIYADYFNAALRFYQSPEQFGFGGNVLKVCCGGGGPYNYNDTALCGYAGVIACDDPSQYASWDGYHFTEAAYRWMTKGLLDGPYTIPKFSVSCIKVIGKLPYGETFFRHATGRCSDGRLVIDFIAEAYGLPYLPPYLKLTKGQNIHRGVNFAVAGATSLDAEFFIKNGIGQILWTNDSLNIQLGWFKKLKPFLCTTKQDCDSYFKRSLFLVGEIGGNDYNYAAFAGGNVTQLVATVPLVVEAITKATSELIAEGAVELVVPGNLPIGCSAVYLTLFRSQNKEDYDNNGCLKAFNGFARYHNRQLILALETLRRKNPHARIIYADYYGAAQRFFHAPGHYGFFGGTLRACCGGGGPFNFNNSARCGHTGSKACAVPSTYANWDGIHLTEAAYRHIAKGLINGPFSNPPLKSSPFKIA